MFTAFQYRQREKLKIEQNLGKREKKAYSALLKGSLFY
jgi:hypothetical protein